MQLGIQNGIIEKKDSEVIVSLTRTVNGSEYKRKFNVKSIVSWHYAKQTDYLPLNRWWTFIIVFGSICLSLMGYTFLKNSTSLDTFELIWFIVSSFLKVSTIVSIALFVVWLLFDLLMGWKIIEALLTRILIRKKTLLCLRFKTDKEFDILLKNKREGVSLVIFLQMGVSVQHSVI